MILHQDLTLHPFQPFLDLRQRKIPITPPLKIDEDSEEILAPATRVIFAETGGQVVFLHIFDFLGVIVYPGETDDGD
jgi:hypothetical protein